MVLDDGSKIEMRNDLTPEEWQEELDKGFEYRRRYGVEDTWRENEALFYNVFSDDYGRDQDNAGPNIVVSTGDSMASALTVPYPYIALENASYKNQVGSKILEREDNKLIEHTRMRKEHIPHATLCGYLYGLGVLKIGYDSEYGWTPSKELREAPGISFSQFDKKGRRIEYGGVTPGMPWVSSILPHDIIVPWGTRSLSSAEWIAHRVVRHIDDIKSDMKYEHTRDLEPVMSMQDFVQSYTTVVKPYRIGEVTKRSKGADEGETEYVELFEIHDRRTGKVFVIATGFDRFLRNERDALQLSGLPFVELGFIPNARSVWRTPDATYIRQAQFELTDITVQATKQRRLLTLKMLYEEGALNEDQLVKLCSARVGAGVKVNKGYDIDKAVKFLTASQNPQIYLEAQQVRQNARESVGQSGENQMGQYSRGRKSATEVQEVAQHADMRAGRRELVIHDAYTDTFRKINAIITKFWKTPRVVDILGEDATLQWLSYVGPELAGDYAYTMTFTNDPPLSPSQKAQMAQQMLFTMGNDPLVDQIELRRQVSAMVNSPQFSRLYQQGLYTGNDRPMQQGGGANAALQLPMSQVQQGGGGASRGQQAKRPQAMLGM
jgi:hypothetical protein